MRIIFSFLLAFLLFNKGLNCYIFGPNGSRQHFKAYARLSNQLEKRHHTINDETIKIRKAIVNELNALKAAQEELTFSSPSVLYFFRNNFFAFPPFGVFRPYRPDFKSEDDYQKALTTAMIDFMKPSKNTADMFIYKIDRLIKLYNLDRALINAAIDNNIEGIKMLLDAGADESAKNATEFYYYSEIKDKPKFKAIADKFFARHSQPADAPADMDSKKISFLDIIKMPGHEPSLKQYKQAIAAKIKEYTKVNPGIEDIIADYSI